MLIKIGCNMVILIYIFQKYYIIKSQHLILEKLYLIHGFYMVKTTYSKSKFTKSIAAEVRDYFESLIKPLVTTESLEKLLGTFQKKIVKRFEEKLDEQNAKIIEHQSKIAIQEYALQRLEKNVTNMSNIVIFRVYVSMTFNMRKMMI